MEKELKVNQADVKAIYDNACDDSKRTLEKIFGKEVFTFDFRTIETFEDACDKLGISHVVPSIKTFANEICAEALIQSMAMYKLLVICKAINDGQQYDENGCGWAPIYHIYNKEELKAMEEGDICGKHLQALSSSNALCPEYVGFRSVMSFYRGAAIDMDCGFPLCVNSEEKALYLDEQFRDLIYELYGIKVKEE